MKYMMHSGKVIYITDPREMGITVEDIAEQLAVTFRPMSMGKQTVAHHSLFCMFIAQELGYTHDQQLACLLHDAHEMFTGDIPSQLKTNGTRKLQKQLDEVILRSLGLPKGFLLQHKTVIKAVDSVALSVEGGYFYGEGFLTEFCLTPCGNESINSLFTFTQDFIKPVDGKFRSILTYMLEVRRAGEFIELGRILKDANRKSVVPAEE